MPEFEDHRFEHRRSDIERTVSGFEGQATTVEKVGVWSCDAFEVWAVRSVRKGQVHLVTAPAVTMQEVYTDPETRMGIVPAAFLLQLRAEALEDLTRLDDLIGVAGEGERG